MRAISSSRSCPAFELPRIDTPAEALLGPWLNPIPRLVSDPSSTQVDTVTLVGDDLLSHRMQVSGDGVDVAGKTNGKEFLLRMPVGAETLSGDLDVDFFECTPGFSEDEQAYHFHDRGRIGDLSFWRRIDVSKDENAEYPARIVGEFGGQPLQSHLKSREDRMTWEGTIGGLSFTQEIEQSSNGAEVHGTLGDETVFQWIGWS